MAGVELNLTKGNSGTQCPLLPSNSAGAPAGSGSTALSKSKKKRLRKKKKVERAVKKESTELTDSIGRKDATISEPSGAGVQPSKKGVCVSIIDVGPNKRGEVSSPSEFKLDSKTSESCVIGPALKSRVKKVEDVPKQKTAADIVPTVEASLKTNHVTSHSHSKPVVRQSVTAVAMDSSKPPRDDVMAQREAKKLAKLSKKTISGGGGTASAPTQPDPKANHLNTSAPLATELSKNAPNAQNSSPVSSATSQMSRMSLDTIDGEIVQPVRQVGQAVALTPKTGPPSNNKGPSEIVGKPEKPREDVLAEREAKKLAKIAAKNKKKEGAAEVTKDQPKEDQTASENMKTAPNSGELPTSSIQKDVDHSRQGVSASEKSKAALKAERRAKQEAQRAAKEGSKKEAGKTKPAETPAIKSESLKKEKSTSPQKKPQASKTVAAKSSSNQLKLLSHLLTDNRPLPAHIYQNVHPAIVELGAKYAARVVSGSNARCIALLQALKKVIVDFITPREKEFSRAMETRLNDSMAYVNACRQSSVSMMNALKHVKSHLTQLTTEKTTDDEARKKLCDVIDTFIKEQIDVAGEAISIAVAQKISNGDTIAIYGCSSLLLRILVESHNEGKDFEVVVVDGGPLYEGREMCRRLVSENIKCSYVLLPAFSYIVGQTTKVLLGAHALLANGCVMSRSGTAVVAMLAKTQNVPVIVCCETYKFCERVQADAFVHNELGPQHTVSTPPSFSLMYDMTPPTLVDAVATELAILPCTSVPVILRVKPSDVSSYYY